MLAHAEADIAIQVAIQAEPRKLNRFVTKLGNHPFYDGKLTIDFFEKDGKIAYKVSWHVQDGVDSIGPSNPNITKESKWIGFVESEKTVWVFDGAGSLQFHGIERGKAGAEDLITSATAFSQGKVHSREHVRIIPRELLARLPKNLQDQAEQK
jgi:hypothetical protein